MKSEPVMISLLRVSFTVPCLVYQAGYERRDYGRNRPLGRDRYGNEYWRFAGDRNLVLVRRHGCWWGVYDGPNKVRTTDQRSYINTMDQKRHM